MPGSNLYKLGRMITPGSSETRHPLQPLPYSLWLSTCWDQYTQLSLLGNDSHGLENITQPSSMCSCTLAPTIHPPMTHYSFTLAVTAVAMVKSHCPLRMSLWDDPALLNHILSWGLWSSNNHSSNQKWIHLNLFQSLRGNIISLLRKQLSLTV